MYVTDINLLVILIVIFVFVGWFSTNGINKSQVVCLLNIFLYGPILIWVGFVYIKDNMCLRFVLLFMGVTTMVYNLRNLLSSRKKYDSAIVHPASM
jgi:hypothetical protein